MSEDESAGAWEEQSVPLDKEAEQRELEAAGWERVERAGKTVWRHPTSGHLYPQRAAMQRLGRDSDSEEEEAPPEEPDPGV